MAHTVAGADSTIWLKIVLDRVYCVEHVIRYYGSQTITKHVSWSCTDRDCNDCKGDSCSNLALTVSTEGAESDMLPALGCKYGNTVQLEKISGDKLTVREIAIIGKQGKLHISKVNSILSMVGLAIISQHFL